MFTRFLVLFFLCFVSFILFAQESLQGSSSGSSPIYITLDAKEKSLRDILEFFRQEIGAEIHVEEEISKKITLTLIDVPWPEALHIVAEQVVCEVTSLSQSTWLVHKSPLVNIEFQDADIRVVLQTIASVAKVKIKCSEDIEGRLNIRLKDVLWFEALMAIAKTVDPSYRVIRKSRYEAHVLSSNNTMKASESLYITLDVREKELREVVRYISEQTGIKILVVPGISKKVTLNLEEVPWLEALIAAVKQANCMLTKVADDTWKVSNPPLITIEFQGADLQKVINTIATIANINIIYSEEIQGVVDVHLRDVPWMKALDRVIKSADPSYEISTVSRNVLRIIKTEEEFSSSPLEKGDIVLDVQGENIHKALNLLRKQTKDRILIHPSIHHPITLSLRNVSLKSALFEIAKQAECEVLAMKGNWWSLRPMLRINLKIQSDDKQKMKRVWEKNSKDSVSFSKNRKGYREVFLEEIPWHKAAELIEQAREEGFLVKKNSDSLFVLYYQKNKLSDPDSNATFVEEVFGEKNKEEKTEKRCRYYEKGEKCPLGSNKISDFCALHFDTVSRVNREEEIFTETNELMEKLKNTVPGTESEAFVYCIVALDKLFKHPVKIEWIQSVMKESFSSYKKIRDACYDEKGFKKLIAISLKVKSKIFDAFSELQYQECVNTFALLKVFLEPVKEKSLELQTILEEAKELKEKASIYLQFSKMPLEIDGIVWIEKYPKESIAIINGESKKVGEEFIKGLQVADIRKGEVVFFYKGESITKRMFEVAGQGK